MKIKTLKPSEIKPNLEQLTELLINVVNNDAAVGFLKPLSENAAKSFWLETVYPDVLDQKKVLFVFVQDDKIVGTVQLLTGLPANQPHRCEILKMMVHSAYRKQGIGAALMNAALETAASLDKTLVVLDTRTGDVAESFYKTLGFSESGRIPDFALDPDGRTFHSTTYMYCRIPTTESKSVIP